MENLNQIPQNPDLAVLPTDDPTSVEKFAEQHPEIFCKYLFKRLRTAVNDTSPFINLFKFKNTNRVVQMSHTDYESQLNNLMKYFIKTENYELAGECKDTLLRHKQNEEGISS